MPSVTFWVLLVNIGGCLNITAKFQRCCFVWFLVWFFEGYFIVTVNRIWLCSSTIDRIFHRQLCLMPWRTQSLVQSWHLLALIELVFCLYCMQMIELLRLIPLPLPPFMSIPFLRCKAYFPFHHSYQISKCLNACSKNVWSELQKWKNSRFLDV